jgi:hypothetical protein
MQPLAAELGYINGLLRRADTGELHLPDGVTEVEDDDDKPDPEDTVLSKGRSRSTEPDVYLYRKRKQYESCVPLDRNVLIDCSFECGRLLGIFLEEAVSQD